MRWIVASCALVATAAYAVDPFEPDNSAGQARAINNFVFESGRNLSVTTDQDWYRFTLQNPATIIAETLHRAPGGDEVDVTILTSGQNEVDFRDDSIALDLGAGQYYVRLQPAGQGNTIPDYKFVFSTYPYRADAFEPNDFRVGSPRIEAGTIYRGLSITPDEEDWFEVIVPSNGGGARPFVLQATSPVRVMGLELFNSSGGKEIAGLYETSMVGSVSPGTYYPALTEIDDDLAVPQYDLVFWLRDGPDPYESDNTRQTANRLPVRGADHSTFGQEQIHNIFPSNDEDWFRFRVEMADNFQFNAFSVVGGDPNVEVFDSQNNLLAGPFLGGATISNPPDGEYFARVTRAGTPAVGDVYEVSVLSIPIPRLTQGSLVGVVQASTKGAALSGATVSLSGTLSASTTTNSAGVYAFDALPQGSYSVNASASGYTAESVGANVGAAVTTVTFALDSAGGGSTDLNNDGTTNSTDIQLAINGALGTGPPADVNNDGSTNSIDIQLVINAVLGI